MLVTADRSAIPPPPPGRATYTHEDVLGRLIKEVTKSADGILGQMRPHVRGRRLWDLTIDQKGESSRRADIIYRWLVRARTQASMSTRP